MLYLLAAKFIFGNTQMSGMVSKLSGTTKNLTTGLLQDPQRVENIIGMVRTVAPLTSPQTVSKVNTYLPLFEKVSTLLGMYSFLNKAQTFRPIESVNVKNPTDMMTALMKNKNSPIGKMIAQPLIQNNVEKMMGTMAMNMIKNGGLNDMLKNGGLNDMLKNGNLSEILSSLQTSKTSAGNNSNIDLNSLMETFAPLISSMSQNISNNSDDIHASYDSNDSHIHDHNNHYNDDREHSYNTLKSKDYFSDYREHPKNMNLINEASLPQEQNENEEVEPFKYDSYQDEYDKYSKQEKFNKQDKHGKYDEYQNIEKPTREKEREFQRPIRIKQRRRR